MPCVRRRQHPYLYITERNSQFSEKKGRMPPHVQLSAQRLARMGLHSSNSCRWKPPNNDHRGDQLRAAIVCIRLIRESGREVGNAVHSGIRTMSNVSGGAAQFKKQPVAQMVHKPTVVALLWLFWNKDVVFSSNRQINRGSDHVSGELTVKCTDTC